MLGGGDPHSTEPYQGSRCWGVEADNLHGNIYAGGNNKPLINLFPSDRREDDPGGNLNLHHYAFNKSHEAHPDGSVADPHAKVNVTTGGTLFLPTDHLVNNHHCKTAYSQEPASIPADPPDPYVGPNPSYKPRISDKVWQGGPNTRAQWTKQQDCKLFRSNKRMKRSPKHQWSRGKLTKTIPSVIIRLSKE